jgi:photosystem II stability/assembly factor-like uncharacterized protein
VYAGTNGGVLKSDDRGASWEVKNTRLTNTFAFALAIDRTTPTTLYAGMNSPDIFKTIDAGDSWSPRNSGLPAFFNVLALGIDAGSPATVYAGLSGGGVFRSTDGGDSRNAASNGLSDRIVKTLATDPVRGGTLYAGTTQGVFKSVDGGASWSAAGLGDVNGLAIDPAAPDTVYAATTFTGV